MCEPDAVSREARDAGKAARYATGGLTGVRPNPFNLEVVKTLDGVRVVREDRPPHRQPCPSQPPAAEEHHGIIFHVHHCMHDATQDFGTTLEHECRCGKKWTTEETVGAGLQ